MSAQSLPTDPSRRQVLCGLAVALLAPGALAACGNGDGGTTTGGTTTAPQTTGGSPGTGTTGTPGGGSSNALAQLSDVPVGGGTLVDAPDGRKVLLVQPSQGTVKAYDPTCTHQGTQVNPPQGDTMVCPRHGSEFALADGSAKKGPASSPLATIPVRVEGNAIVLA